MIINEQGYYGPTTSFRRSMFISQEAHPYEGTGAANGTGTDLTAGAYRTLLTRTHHAAFVFERAYGYELPPGDAYARRLAEQAEAWLAFATERSRMRPATLTRKALAALAFSFRHRASDLAVPSKLVGTSKRQRALWALVGERPNVGLRLLAETGSASASGAHGAIMVSYGDAPLGRVQTKHAPWLAPLLAFGATVHLVRVTGEDYRTLGANVCFARVGPAIERLTLTLGAALPRDQAAGYHGHAGYPSGDSLPGPSNLTSREG